MVYKAPFQAARALENGSGVRIGRPAGSRHDIGNAVPLAEQGNRAPGRRRWAIPTCAPRHESEPGDSNEGVDPLMLHERLWRETTEFTKLRDHVRLIHVTKFGRQPGPVIFLDTSGACQGSAKAGEPAEEFRRQSDFFTEDPSKVLTGNSGCVRKFGDADHSASLLHERRQGREVYSKSVIRTNSKALEQRVFELINALFIASRLRDACFQ